ncbi:hydrogenase nickel incorporation protein HypB [Oceanimonas sp. CHS3-5]|uniref:hydrogenase nickel incorporation protein HypB n=1 Tax=Oceanimonas sp. CHS3-5 TaxID=3068186 RepID=UPI00273E0E55|nr:hydrogenase nickel incorporation protein HypB [Oceanimonas sp. CHS3-5]MDP5291388.1 hydrogenase nickel incorporation protein HypB [Oceanimonas sp. CHS3-5]
MCGHCGCSGDKARLSEPGTGSHRHLHHDGDSLQLQQALLAGNDELARQNRDWLTENHISCINLMGTPGAGKTRLLEASFAYAQTQAGWPSMAVLEGDQQTRNDARRIQASGGRAVQINTGTGCHLDAQMIQAGLASLAPSPGSLVLVENVGNLVCPALFDLGEQHRVAMMAVTDGDDKPEKYPHLFAGCELAIINKADLLPYLDIDLEKIKTSLRRLNPNVDILVLSASTGGGMNAWYDWLLSARV